MGRELAGLGKKERSQLSALLKSGVSVFTPNYAANVLQISSASASQILARWHNKGWLSRVKRGVYIPVPIQAASPEIMADEPWILAQALFQPCYVGGWSAAEHWDFTEQIFNATMVFTTRKLHSQKMKLKGASFVAKTIKEERLFGSQTVWLEGQKVQVSDPSKTVVDAFNDPAVVGGIRMAIDILEKYFRSEHKNLDLLFDYGKRIGNSTTFKRLGFVFEMKFGQELEFISKCRLATKAGLSQLDPAAPGDSLATNWGLWVPASWKGRIQNDNHR